MNMILHGIEAPSIRHTNTITESVMDIQERDRHDIILANPPFGGGERKEVQQNFPIKSGETAYLLLQHFIRKLCAGGRGAVVIKNTFLSNTDNASVALRKELLESCNLHTVLDCPGGTFQGAGVKTVVLFFEKGAKTLSVWYYQLDPGRSLGKTNSLNDTDLAEFVALQPRRADSPKSWVVDVAYLDRTTWDLSVKNPNAREEATLRRPEEIIEAMLARGAETALILEDVGGMLSMISYRRHAAKLASLIPPRPCQGWDRDFVYWATRSSDFRRQVFCATQHHAARLQNFINQVKDNSDPHYCERVTADNGKLGEQHLREFQDNEKTLPTILVTAHKLSTESLRATSATSCCCGPSSR